MKKTITFSIPGDIPDSPEARKYLKNLPTIKKELNVINGRARSKRGRGAEGIYELVKMAINRKRDCQPKKIYTILPLANDPGPLQTDDGRNFEIYKDDRDCKLYQNEIDDEGLVKKQVSITFGTFRGYFTAARKELSNL